MNTLTRWLPHLLGLVVLGTPAPAAADPRHPLLQEGKQSLFQRVLSYPGAQLWDSPGGNGRIVKDQVPSFTVFYVYDRKPVDGGTWVEVGVSSRGDSDGWLEAARLGDWNQTLVLKLAARSGRNPVLFFRQKQDVENLLKTPESGGQVHDLLETVKAGKAGDRVVAVETSDSAISAQRFYLLPIFAASETMAKRREDFIPAEVLQVASVDPGKQETRPPPRAFQTALVFIMDTTRSMDPYIERARQVINKIYESLAEARVADKVSFGLVGFRNSLERTPKLGYLTKVFAPLKPGRGREGFMQLVRGVKATEVSSHSWDEDSLAGVMTALDDKSMDWSDYGARVAFLISDAGPLAGSDPASFTHQNPAEVGAAAKQKQVAIFVLHLKTPQGQKDHEYAQRQYEALTGNYDPNVGPLYVAVPAGDVDQFGRDIENIATEFTQVVVNTANGKPLTPPPASTNDAKSKAAALGYAMAMDFLGRQRATPAPEVVKAWVSDKDLEYPDKEAFEVCLLLNKLQLNDLQQGLKLIVDAAKKTRISPKDFFQEVASAAANLSRDPPRLKTREFSNLFQSGLFGEFLEGLPYRSKALSVSQDLWLSWSGGERQDFINELESKIYLYENYHKNVDNWVAFDKNRPEEALFRVPLNDLP